MAERFDAIVIGSGQAAPALCARMDKEGLKTALIERRMLGGTCVNYGCYPTKTLIASARVAALARRAREFGLVLEGEPRVDMRAVKERMDAVVGQSRTRLKEWIGGMPHVSLIEGHARFASPRVVTVNGRDLEAERIFIDVGARPLVPDLPGIRDTPFFTSTTMLDVDFLPRHLIVVGGSYVGLEFAQMYRRFGSEVTVVERGDRILPREDEDVSREIAAILGREGITLRAATECIGLRKEKGDVTVALACADGPPVATGSHALLAVGRAPNTHDLGTQAAGIRTDARGYIEVDDELRTSAPGVWALGEVNGRGAFTHTAYNDYEIVAANLFDGEKRRVSERIDTYALFIDPPLGRVGMTEAQARARGGQLLAATMPMSRVGRARESGETQGFMKVLVDAASRQVLGASILGLHGDEAVQVLLDAMYARQPYTAVQRPVRIHPTVGELIPTLLENLAPLR